MLTDGHGDFDLSLRNDFFELIYNLLNEGVVVGIHSCAPICLRGNPWPNPGRLGEANRWCHADPACHGQGWFDLAQERIWSSAQRCCPKELEALCPDRSAQLLSHCRDGCQVGSPRKATSCSLRQGQL